MKSTIGKAVVRGATSRMDDLKWQDKLKHETVAAEESRKFQESLIYGE